MLEIELPVRDHSTLLDQLTQAPASFMADYQF